MSRYPIPDEALDDRLAAVGTAGAGKTYAVLGAMERLLHLKARFVGVDPLGVMWGLRSMADGKSSSPWQVVIFGGAHGDLPLTENAGALIGETVATMRESCIVDVSALGSKSAERRFMLAFLEAIYRHTDQNKSDPYHLILDEADRYAPQKPMDGDEMLLNRVEEIVRRGRVKGFIPWLITQRPAVLNKNVLSQVDGLIALKLTSSQDRDQIGAWVENAADREEWKRIRGELPALQRGTGIIWIPARGILKTVTFPERLTFDSSRSPKRGEKRRDATIAPIDLAALKGKLATLEVETKANDPKLLRAEVARLNAELKKAKPEIRQPDPDLSSKVAAARGEGFADGHRAGFFDGLAHAHTIAVLGAKMTADECTRTAESIRTAIYVQRTPPTVKSDANYSKPIPRPVAQPVEHRNLTPKVAGSNPAGPAISHPKQRILNALAWFATLGRHHVDKGLVAFLADASPTSSAFANNLGALRAAGLIEYPSGGVVALTHDGEAAAEAPKIELTPDAIQAAVFSKLGEPQRRILAALIKSYPMTIGRSDLADMVDASATSSAYANNLGRLRSMGFLQYHPGGQIAATPMLFGEA